MSDLLSIWSRYVNRQFGTARAIAPLRRADRRRASWSIGAAVEFLEARSLLSGIPALHSNPGAPATLYLDFDGHVADATTTPVYDADGDATTFNTDEMAFMENVWRVVAEDYAPFNINVSTVEPAVLAPGVPDSQANGVALRIAIGGLSSGGGGGGLANYDSFTNSRPNVAWVYAQGQTDAVLYGQFVSHEAGHSFGLRHQIETVNPGFTWAPIMASAAGFGGFGPIPATWHNGVVDTGSAQDDIAMLARPANAFGFRADDHAGTIGGATPLAGGATSFTGTGIIGAGDDIDIFSLTTTQPQNLRITVDGDQLSQNLDAVIELRNASGTLLVSANPGDSLDAFVIGDVAGTVYVAVKSNGVYGRIGQYSVTVTESYPGVRVATSKAPLTTSESGRDESITLVLDARPTADVTFNFTSSDPTEGTVSMNQVIFTPANWFAPQVVMITGISDGVADGAVRYTVAVSPALSDDPAYNGFNPADLTVVNLDDRPGQLYWLESYVYTDAAYVMRSSLVGENIQTLVDLKAVFGPPVSYFTPSRIALDPAAGKMYWTDNSSDTIRRANLDGSLAETIVIGLPNPRGIAVDSTGGKLYWADDSSDRIQRANLDGSSVEDVIATGLNTPGELELDPAAGKMYWTDSDNFSISRANLDGSGAEIVLPSDGISRPSGLELDLAAGKMYYSLRVNNQTSRLYRADLSGANSELLMDVSTIDPAYPKAMVNGLTIDHVGARVYWTDANAHRIYSADLDGSKLALVAERVFGMAGIAILLPTPGFTVTPASGLATTEAGGSTTFTVVLNAPPTADVVISLSSSDTTEGAPSTSSLTFTPANWNVTQTVTVSGVNDTVVDGDIIYTIVVAAAVSSDASYHGLNPSDVSVTNLDDDVLPTKFYVVNDATQNLTYEYNVNGGLIESYGLNSGNTAPRGAASTIAGDKTWVVDANRKVYIYNASGGLLGSWTAGTLASNATVEGITTNGTDVWIVDAKSDKAYKYAGAATRLTGSQNAASSFSLNGSNTSPKDIVTDGTYLWFVNDSTTDKVFKYTFSGSLVASWTIATSGAGSPTGITLDPSNPAHLWIVDSATDRVYEYSDAVNQANGSSRSANGSFALAAGNTNPQGIADPPPQGSLPATGTIAFAGPGSVSSAFVPRTVTNMSWSSLKKVTSELSVQDNSLRREFTESRESANVDGRSSDLGLSKEAATKRLGKVFPQSNQILSNDIAGGTDLDDLFADWSADPLQLLLSNGR